MTDDAVLPFPVLPPKPTRTWLVTMADASTRTVEAHGFRVEHGALVLVLPAGCAAAYAPGLWNAIEEARTV